MDRVRKQVGAEEIYQKDHKHGKREEWKDRSVTVGVLDTGVFMHPDLDGRITEFQNFAGPETGIMDDNGHGTHICGIIAGNGKMSQGRLRGIAPNTRLIVGKVLDRNGDGRAENMLKALDWMIEVRKDYGIRVINISVGIGESADKNKEYNLKQKIEEAWEKGIVVVCAAGNGGPADGSISLLAMSDKVITVGCYDAGYRPDGGRRCEAYSGRGRENDIVVKPDVVAPGTDIFSCKVCKNWKKGEYPYISKSGTSMATPVVTAAAALLLQKYPGLDNEEVKRRILYTATDLKEPWNFQGWGMINIKKMLERY